MCQHFVPVLIALQSNGLKATDLKIKSRQIKGDFELRFLTPFPCDSRATQITIHYC